ncbi:hypothetical protein [Paenibacillus hubeiensis]|uniref:hypothetical protein n=1 Tax=Paenibacillus hubeiensis TaxID=3077330 RepID=UPI0031BBBF69
MFGKDQLTTEQREALLHQNIAEIGQTVGVLISIGVLPKCELDLPTEVISENIVLWAKEFEDRFSGPKFDYEIHGADIGWPLGYIDAIDNFTDLKLREANWLTADYTNDESRFWNQERWKKHFGDKLNG